MARAGYLAGILGSIFEARRGLAAPPDGRPIIEQCRVLMSARGEAPTLRLARSILATYRDLEENGRLEFFDYLTNELDIDAHRVAQEAEAYGSNPTAQGLSTLLEASEPKRQTLFRKLNQAEGATPQLVGMREDVLKLLKERPEYGKIDIDLEHLFSSWFNRGFLVLESIDWSTPARVLEKIIAYEAVHEINDWDDLRRRTEPSDRRCYAYVHPQMPEEPLIFVEIALTKGVPTSVQNVLAREREILAEDATDTAVFYSISNCQRGLQGISFGESLIKHVVADLSADLPHLKTFVTLSPIPGLNAWMQTPEGENNDVFDALSEAAGDNDAERLDAQSENLRALASHYLARQKRADGLPADPVARFHLSNGAQIENVLAGADMSAKGLSQSCGAMVNYLYRLKDVEQNSERFATDGAIPLSRRVQSLVKSAQSLLGGDKKAAAE